jgi:hypothetical protein
MGLRRITVAMTIAITDGHARGAGFAIRSLHDMQIVLSASADDALTAFPSVRSGS